MRQNPHSHGIYFQVGNWKSYTRRELESRKPTFHPVPSPLPHSCCLSCGQGFEAAESFVPLSLKTERSKQHHYRPPRCCCCSVAQACPTLCDPLDCSTPGLPVHHQLPELTQTHVHWVGDAIQPSHPLSSPSPPAFNPSSIRVFSNESVLCIRWQKYWRVSFSTSPSNEHSGLISLWVESKSLWPSARRATVLSALCRRDHMIRFTI